MVDIIGGITSLLGGGITGIVGTIVSSVYTYKSKQLDVQMQKDKDSHEVEMQKAEAAIMQQEWAARTQVAQITADAQMDAEASKSFAASQSSEPQRYATGALTPAQNWLMVVLDLFRGVIRPVLTVYLVVLTTLIYLQARELIGGGIPVAEATGLVNQIINTVLYLTSTVVLWWFGSRAHDKKQSKGEK